MSMSGVEKFNGSNDFDLWRIRMRAVLVVHGLERAIDGEMSLFWTTKEVMSKALSLIHLSLSDNVLREVCDLETVPAVWKKLNTLYGKKPPANRLCLKMRLYGLQMIPGTSIADHVNLFEGIIRDLHNIGVDISDEDQALRLWCSLPLRYKNHVEKKLGLRTSITLEDVKSALKPLEQSSSK